MRERTHAERILASYLTDEEVEASAHAYEMAAPCCSLDRDGDGICAIHLHYVDRHDLMRRAARTPEAPRA